MVAPVTISELDLRALVGIVSDERADLSPQGLPLSLLSDLTDQVHCDVVSFVGLDTSRQTIQCMQDLPVGEADDQSLWEHYWGCRFTSYPNYASDLRTVAKVSDFYSARQWQSTGMYRDYFRPQGIEHVIVLCLPATRGQTAGSSRTLRLVFHRGPGLDFSERDRGLLTLLRPHLYQAYLDAERRRHDPPNLTPRHWELLHLVAAGHTNAQIGRRLGVSEGTVRTHLQNIYGRLQVSSRTAAVTHAFPTSTVT